MKEVKSYLVHDVDERLSGLPTEVINQTRPILPNNLPDLRYDSFVREGWGTC